MTAAGPEWPGNRTIIDIQQHDVAHNVWLSMVIVVDEWNRVNAQISPRARRPDVIDSQQDK